MKFKKIAFLSLFLCFLASSAFAKAGYDRFGVVVDDPMGLYTGDVQFKYNCVKVDGSQKQHALVAKRYGDRLIGTANHNLICSVDDAGYHGLYSITIGLTKVKGGYFSHTYTVKFHQHANALIDCHLDVFGKAVCSINR